MATGTTADTFQSLLNGGMPELVSSHVKHLQGHGDLTGGQAVGSTTLAFATPLPSVDPLVNGTVLVPLNGNTTLSAMSTASLAPGQTFSIGQQVHWIFGQDNVGGRTLAFDASYSITNWTLNTGANAPTDLWTTWNGSKWVLALNPVSTAASPFTIPGGPGAALPVRFIGANVSGPPTSGTWQLNDHATDQSGTEWICTAAGTAAPTYTNTILALTPRGYWHLGDGGTPAADSSGNGLSGTFGAGVTTGQTSLITAGDNAMAFSGASTAQVQVLGANPGSAGPFTLEAWVKPNALGGLLVFGATDGTGNLWVSFTGSGQASFRTNSGAANADLNTAGGLIVIGNGYHIVCTFDGTNKRVYVNGVLSAGPTAATVAVPATTLFIASRGGSLNFNGTIDEAALYDYALSAAQVLNNYNTGLLIGIAGFSGLAKDALVAHLAGAETFTGIKSFAQPLAGSTIGLFLDKSGHVANVKAFQGVGDGVADDTVPLNNAWTSATTAATLALLYIPAAFWKYTSLLNWVGKDLVIMGAGIARTLMKPTAFGGSSLIFGATNFYGGNMRDLTVTGPGVYANPNTNPGDTAGVDGVEAGSSSSFLRVCVTNCSKGFVFNLIGGHNRLNGCFADHNYYSTYWKNSGFDDYIEGSILQNAMFANVGKSGTIAAGLGITWVRSHLEEQPFAVYEEAGTCLNFISGWTAYQLSLELVGNAVFYSANYANANAGTFNALDIHSFNWSYSTGTMQRTDQPHDYAVVVGGTNQGGFIYGLGNNVLNHDKGFLFMQTEPSADYHWYMPGTSAIFVQGAGDGHSHRWHGKGLGNYQGTATFGAASANNATKNIGANFWIGAPASVQLIVTPTTDGALTNGFNLLAGAVTSSPALLTPGAPTAALITVAGNIDTGNHSYKQVQSNGGLNGQVGTTAGGVASNVVANDGSNQQNTVTLEAKGVQPIGAPTVTISIYRNKVADQTHWFLVQSGIALGTVSITDNLADASLGAAMPTTNTTEGWQATVTLKTTATQTGNPSFAYALKNQ